MGLKRWLTEKFLGDTIQELVQLKLSEAAGSVDPIDQDEWQYRRLTGAAKRDLPPVKHSRMLEIAHYLYDYNPFAKWLMNSQRDFLVAEGINLRAKDQANQPLLNKFWLDAINRMPLKLPQKIVELAIFGEQCWPIFTNKMNGMVRLANVDPSRIKSVIHDPHNSEEPIGIVLMAPTDQVGTTDGLKLKIVKSQPDEEIFHPETVLLRQSIFIDGECFWYKVNSTSHQTRGISDLFALADWLDGYEELMFNTRDRVAYINAFCWDAELKGKSEDEIKTWIAANPPPRPGSWFAHNENIKLTATTPDLQGRDNDLNARLFRNHILGSSNWPEHWYGGAGNVNRATAQVMETPTFKALQARQILVKSMIEDVVKLYLLRTHAAQETNLDDPDEYFEVILPRMDVKDITVAATNLLGVSNAAGIAEDRGWIEPAHAQRLFIAAAALLGVDIPTNDLPVPATPNTTPEYQNKNRTTNGKKSNVRTNVGQNGQVKGQTVSSAIE